MNDFFENEIKKTLYDVDAQRKDVDEAYKYILDLIDGEVLKRYQAWRDIDKYKRCGFNLEEGGNE
jgi:hypothetical protein